jgi:hypothetical protein
MGEARKLQFYYFSPPDPNERVSFCPKDHIILDSSHFNKMIWLIATVAIRYIVGTSSVYYMSGLWVKLVPPKDTVLKQQDVGELSTS